MLKRYLFLIFLYSPFFLQAAVESPQKSQSHDVKLRSTKLKNKISKLENELSGVELKVASIKTELGKLEKLLKIQALEIELGMVEIEETELQLEELLVRKDSLEESIENRELQIKESLSVLYTLKNQNALSIVLNKNYRMQSYLKETIKRLTVHVRSELLEIESLYKEQLAIKIQTEKRREDLIAHIDDLKERKKILELNKELKKTSLSKKQKNLAQKIKSIKAAKLRESRLKKMLLNSQRDKKTETEDKKISTENSFSHLKGKLRLPVEGSIIGTFGKKYDKKTSLYTFHKGIDINTSGRKSVKSIYPGTVVFSGTLGGYGGLLIIDHGDRYFTLTGQLEKRLVKEGVTVTKGQVIGFSNPDGTPVYLEIRRRHVAIDPLPWFQEGSDFKQINAQN